MSFIPQIQANTPLPNPSQITSSIKKNLHEIECELLKNDYDCNYKKLDDLIKILPKELQECHQIEESKAKIIVQKLQNKLQGLKSNPESYRICLSLWGYFQRCLLLCYHYIVISKNEKENEEESITFFAYYFHLIAYYRKNSPKERYVLDPLIYRYLQENKQIDWSVTKKLGFLIPSLSDLSDVEEWFEVTLIRNFMYLTDKDREIRETIYRHIIDFASRICCDSSLPSAFTEKEKFIVLDLISYFIEYSLEKDKRKNDTFLTKMNKALLYFLCRWQDSELMSPTFQLSVLELLQKNKINPHDVLFIQCLQRLAGLPDAYKKVKSGALLFLNHQSFSKDRALCITKMLDEHKEEGIQLDFGTRVRIFIDNIQDEKAKQLMFDTTLKYLISQRDPIKVISLISANPDYFISFDISDFYQITNHFVKLDYTIDKYEGMEIFFHYYFSLGNFNFQSYFLQLITLDYLKFTRDSYFNINSSDDHSATIIRLHSHHLSQKEKTSSQTYISKYAPYLLSYVATLINIEAKPHYDCYLEFLDRLFCSSFDNAKLNNLVIYAITTMLTIIKIKKHPYVFSKSFNEKISHLSKHNSLHVIIARLLENDKSPLNKKKRYTQSTFHSELEKQAEYILGKQSERVDGKKAQPNSSCIINHFSFLPFLPLLAEKVFGKSIDEAFRDLILHFDKDVPPLSILLTISNRELLMNFADFMYKTPLKIQPTIRKMLHSITLGTLISHLTLFPKRSLLNWFLELPINYAFVEIFENFPPAVHMLIVLIFNSTKLEGKQLKNLLAYAQKIAPRLKIDESREVLFNILYQIDPNKQPFEVKAYQRYFQVMKLLIEKNRRKELQKPKAVPTTKLEYHYLYALFLRNFEKSRGLDRSGFQFLATLHLKTLLGEDFEEPLVHMKKYSLLENPQAVKIQAIIEDILSNYNFFESVTLSLKQRGLICISENEYLGVENWGNKRGFVRVPKTIHSIEMARGIIYQGIQLMHLDKLNLKRLLKKQVPLIDLC